ncbi:hypothetical protein QUF80_00015 [Desulfococcaceae bacterium HSG8]|nr:hypothetical protein [Desulfococcaceae bacterium HSG8]
MACEPNKFHPQRLIMMTDPLRHIFYKNGDHAISPIRFKRMLAGEADFQKIKYIAFQGKGSGFSAVFNYKIINISTPRLKWLHPFIAPWFIITATKKTSGKSLRGRKL